MRLSIPVQHTHFGIPAPRSLVVLRLIAMSQTMHVPNQTADAPECKDNCVPLPAGCPVLEQGHALHRA